ncbi:MAG: peptide chain release factor 1 [Acidobacteria bacterium]|nr:peptide chain release factor 1 [Acidobacteriota bacterium]
MQWLHKLEEIEQRYDALSAEMADPAIMQDQARYQKTAKSASDLTEVVDRYRAWKETNQQIEEAKTLLSSEDEEMRELAQEEVSSLEPKLADLENEMQLLLLPKDPNDDKSIVLEVRAGTGGQEATLFAAELFRMYLRYAEGQRWKVEITEQSDSEVGGYKEIIALISGTKVFSKLKFESGVHRVQRVPQTETQGRIHTSAASVAVMPQVEDVDVHIENSDLRVDYYCSSGPGGQSVNTTYSAVRITHVPTGLVVTCQDEKSQIKNKAKALLVLRSRLYEIERERQHQEQADARRGMVGSGDRSEKIRTYNFPQNRVTDHRVPGLTLHQLDLVLEGRLDPLIDALTTHFQTEALKAELVTA